ncbi:spore germination protein [Neobacillus niacini]|uniref:spore germination protein n=1 Tax=Neobacillus niacini TaxID=86668 RepID=UPI00285A6108|nr:spore germination protein [Neobacillus niacini]MDR7001344.1 hypothetical protein [Neobacillus niacini]
MGGCDRGPIIINEIRGGNVNFGGSLVVSPKTAGKSVLGTGSGNTAVFNFSITGADSTNTIDSDVFDQPVDGNT